MNRRTRLICIVAGLTWSASATLPPARAQHAPFHPNLGPTVTASFDTDLAKYTRAIKQNPKDATAYYNRGRIYFANILLQDNKALNDFTAAIKLNANYWDAYVARGAAYAESVEYPEAIADYTRAISIDPKRSASVYVKRGDAYEELKHHQKAIRDYGQAISMQPKEADTYRLRGIAYEAINQYGKAIDDYERAQSLDARFVGSYKSLFSEPYGNRAIEYLARKQYKQAKADFDKAITLAPNEAKHFRYRGITYQESGQAMMADLDFATASKLQAAEWKEQAVENTGFDWEMLGAYSDLCRRRTFTVSGYTYRPVNSGFEIAHGSKVVYEAKAGVGQDCPYSLDLAFTGAKRISTPGKIGDWDYSKLKPTGSAAIRLEKGGPLMFVIEHDAGGAHAPIECKFFALGDKFRKVAQFDASNNADSTSCDFVDFYGDGTCAAVLYDHAFAYWHAAYCDSPSGAVILRLKNGKFELAQDLMKCKSPDGKCITQLVKQTQTKLAADQAEGAPTAKGKEPFLVQPIVFSNLIDLIYSGNGNAAWTFLDQLWPPGRPGIFGDESGDPSKTITKQQFIAIFKKQLSTSRYWSEIKALNGWK